MLYNLLTIFFSLIFFYTAGQDTSPVSPRNYNTPFVASLAAAGTATTKRLVVCLRPPAAIISPNYLAVGLGPGQFQNPDPLPSQLIEYSAATFMGAGKVPWHIMCSHTQTKLENILQPCTGWPRGSLGVDNHAVFVFLFCSYEFRFV